MGMRKQITIILLCATISAIAQVEDYHSHVIPDSYRELVARHGARDRDTAFPIPLNLALLLQNNGQDVNYLLAWNRPHSGDYALDELFNWIKQIQ